MRLIVLGDTHGRLNWKDIVAKELESSDKIVFIGDYFDTHGDISPEQQLSNFNEIVAYKRANMDKVVMLIGNHDYHYMSLVNDTYSGYQSGYAKSFNESIETALADGLMQMCYTHAHFVFSHAGVTRTWCTNSGIDINLRGIELEKAINDLFIKNRIFFSFQMGDNFSRSGNDVTQPPIWVRPESLLSDMIDDIICVVGHTTVQRLGLMDELPKIILIDCLGTTGEYLIIENKIPSIGK
jgi:predicted phosphodiesterase